MKFLMMIIVAAACVATAPDQSSGKEIRKDYHESFEVEKGYGLRLKSGDGEVTIRRWDKDEIDVEIHYFADLKLLGSGERDFEVEFRRKKNIIEVNGQEKSTGTIGFQIFDVKEYTYTIHAPDYVTIDIDGEDGEIDIEGWRNNIEIRVEDGDVSLADTKADRVLVRTEDGDVDIEELEGDLDLSGEDGQIEIYRSRLGECVIRHEDGDINVRDSEGNFDIETDDGDIDLYRIKTSRLNLQTNDGTVDVELQKTGDLDMDVRADDGSVNISLQEGISATFTIDVDGGRIRVDLPGAENIQKGRHWLSGTLNDGKGRIRIRTSDGNVNLQQIR